MAEKWNRVKLGEDGPKIIVGGILEKVDWKDSWGKLVKVLCDSTWSYLGRIK